MIEFVILKRQFWEEEIRSRIHYCNSVFRLYFTYQVNQNFIKINSFPNTETKYLFVIGHNNSICNYLLSREEEVKNVVIISCKIPTIFTNNFRAKRIYASKREGNRNYYYNGKEWGFDFDITEDELDLFNNRSRNIQEKIEAVFSRVK